jgi:hypothetical protein
MDGLSGVGRMAIPDPFPLASQIRKLSHEIPVCPEHTEEIIRFTLKEEEETRHPVE